MTTHVALAMSLTGVEATLVAGGSRIRAGETDTEMADMRDRTEMDIGTTNMRDLTEMDIEMTYMRGRIETDTGAADMREGIDPMIHAGDTTEETGVMIHAGGMTEETDEMIYGGGTTEETDVMIQAGDTIEETDVTIHAGDTNTETAAMIRAAGMREGDMTLLQNRIRSPLTQSSERFDLQRRKRQVAHSQELLHNLGDVSMFPSMKENVEARRVKPSRGKEPVRSQSIKITFEGDMATTPIRVAATKSVRGSTSKKTDTDYVMAEKDGQRIDGEEVILSPRKRGVKKFLMKSSLDEIDTVEPLRRALRQPMQCCILEYLAASKPARDELQIIMRKTRIPLSEEA
ncbi:hypothetical protein CBR_g31429 [Chara braunii]|uniref:Uncharacterized protein n=1 Tax=Chara braunii TaxID=69332 RepID=A0A388LF76_CHABU|nr:hypothetical protein CBR_g31429 [Chara braunii]|eukprot:GBG80873.1 hypothetical protein CBR_g31429 [Chara braunii]